MAQDLSKPKVFCGAQSLEILELCYQATEGGPLLASASCTALGGSQLEMDDCATVSEWELL